MSQLIKSVVSGGVVYPAGTPASDKLLAKIPARFWDEVEPKKPASPKDSPADTTPEPEPEADQNPKPAKKAAKKAPAKKAASPKEG